MAGGCAAHDRAEDAADADGTSPSASLPFIQVDRDQRRVDVAGHIVMREGMLEMVACVPESKEHESIIAIKAQPQHIHLALLMIGLEPGRPGHWVAEGEALKPVDATGDRIQLSVLWRQDEQMVETPVNEMIVDRRTEAVMAENVFVFAGSELRRLTDDPNDEPLYSADRSGNVVTLVTFPDEMATVPSAASSANEMVDWYASPDTIPPIGTPVTLRFEPAPD